MRALEVRRIPHVLVGGRSFHDREEVIALRSAAAALEWPDDTLSVYATLRGPFFALGDDQLDVAVLLVDGPSGLGDARHPAVVGRRCREADAGGVGDVRRLRQEAERHRGSDEDEVRDGLVLLDRSAERPVVEAVIVPEPGGVHEDHGDVDWLAVPLMPLRDRLSQVGDHVRVALERRAPVREHLATDRAEPHLKDSHGTFTDNFSTPFPTPVRITSSPHHFFSRSISS